MKKVAAYCRVSTDNDDQLNSLESQKRYFEDYISKTPDWELIEIYADEGITGTSTKKRKAFNKMIADAELGKLDLILTKEISRFARNTLDSIFYTRKLKDLGIAVIFLNDNINTLDPDSELRLTIMSSIAQEESRKTSERVKWGQKRQMERGIAFGCDTFGYDYKSGKLFVNQKEAEIVKLVFYKYLEEGKGLNRIAKELEETGVLTKKKNKSWSANSISRLLRNEKYCGDLIQRKTYTVSYLTRQKKLNKGEEDFIIVKDNHEPIISRETFERAQREIARRTNVDKKSGKYSNRYAFSGRLQCGLCGATYISRNKVGGDKRVTKRWECSTAFKYGNAYTAETGETMGCMIQLIRDEILQQVFMLALGDFMKNKQGAIDGVMAALEQVLKPDDIKDEQKELIKQLERLDNKKQELIELYLDHTIDKEYLKKMTEKLDGQLLEVKSQLESSGEKALLYKDFDTVINGMESHISNIVYAETFSEEVVKSTLDKIVIHGRNKFDVYFNGCNDRFFFAQAGLVARENHTRCSPMQPGCKSSPIHRLRLSHRLRITQYKEYENLSAVKRRRDFFEFFRVTELLKEAAFPSRFPRIFPCA